MAHDLHVYGSLDPIYFKVTKNGVGVTGQAPFSTGDIQLSIDGGTFSNIDTEVTEVGLGWYKWTPTGTETQGQVLIINVKEVVGTNFDENGLVIATGGNASARFSG
jgi:hypothetical protein